MIQAAVNSVIGLDRLTARQTILSGNYFNTPGLASSVGTDQIGLTCANRPILEPTFSQPTKAPASQAAIDQNTSLPPGRLEIDRDATNQPAANQLAPGDSNMVRGSSDIFSTPSLEISV